MTKKEDIINKMIKVAKSNNAKDIKRINNGIKFIAVDRSIFKEFENKVYKFILEDNKIYSICDNSCRNYWNIKEFVKL